MNAEEHFIFSLVSIILAKKIALTNVLYKGDWWHIIPGVFITCLIPDIDHPKSFIGKRFTWLSIPIFKIFGHRGFTHSLLSIILMILFFDTRKNNNIIPTDAFHAMIIGYLSHIIGDMFTPLGVPLFWPYKYKFKIPVLNTIKSKKTKRFICILILIFSFQYSKDSSNIFFLKTIIKNIIYFYKNFLNF